MKAHHLIVPFTLSLLLMLCGMANSAQTTKAQKGGATVTASAIRDDGLIDLNRASKEQLMSLRGVDETIAQKIIEGRPYGSKADLRAKEIVSSKLFYKILNKVKVPLEKIERAKPSQVEPASVSEKEKKSTKN